MDGDRLPATDGAATVKVSTAPHARAAGMLRWPVAGQRATGWNCDVCDSQCSYATGELLSYWNANTGFAGIDDKTNLNGCLCSDREHAECPANSSWGATCARAVSVYWLGVGPQFVAARFSGQGNHIFKDSEKHNLVGGVDGALVLDATGPPTADTGVTLMSVGEAFTPVYGPWLPASVLHHAGQPGVSRCGGSAGWCGLRLPRRARAHTSTGDAAGVRRRENVGQQRLR